MYFILFLEGVRIIFCSVLGETIEAEWPFLARALFPSNTIGRFWQASFFLSNESIAD